MLDREETATAAFAMVGLPARGKTYVARRVARYLSWLGHPTRVFNIGAYRREKYGAYQPHEFFDPDNPVGHGALLELAMLALDDMLSWLAEQPGRVGIYDATNSTRERRRIVRDRCKKAGMPLVFIESICNDPAVIDANVRETKISSPDYRFMEAEDAMRDFRSRIAHYERAYEPISDTSKSYIKIIDVGRQVVLNRIHGYLPARLAPLLINLHVAPRPIYLTRHGESMANGEGTLGGDSDLTPRGEAYARSLARFISSAGPEGRVTVWTSRLKRTDQTAAPLGRRTRAWRALDEIDAGICDGKTYNECKAAMPDEWAARARDKFHYRYPRGESYEDVIQRLDPVVIELERQRDPVLVIGHQAVLRMLYAYLMDKPPQECTRVSIPLHTVIQLTPTAYGCEERRFQLDPQLPVEIATRASG